MVNVKLNEDDVVNVLIERLRYWTQNEDTIELYEQMYRDYVEGGCFDGIELDVMQIVDNDWVNWCDIIGDDDENWEKLVELYEEGNRDVSCENVGYSFIEAYNPTLKLMLIRY